MKPDPFQEMKPSQAIPRRKLDFLFHEFRPEIWWNIEHNIYPGLKTPKNHYSSDFPAKTIVY